MAKAKAKKPVEKAAGTVIDFSQYYSPHPIQAIAHAAPERYILFGGCIGGGKSFWGCGEMIQACLDYPGNIVLISRFDHSTFMLTTYATMMRIIPPALIAYHHHTAPYEIGLINNSRILYGGLKTTRQDDPFSRLKSMEIGGAFVDEASDLPEDYFKWMMSRVRWNPQGITIPENRKKICLTSNPERSWLYEVFIKPQLEGKKKANYLFVPSRPTDNPYLDPGYITNLRQQFSLDWQERYLEGKWVFADDDLSIIPYSLAKQGMDCAPLCSLPIQLGIDVARKGGAETVIARRQGNHVEIVRTFSYTDLATARKFCMLEIDKATALNGGSRPRTAVDTVGLGAGLYDELRALGYPVVEARANEKAQDETRFANAVSEWWWKVRQELEAGTLSIAYDEKLLGQLTGRRWGYNEKRIDIESKDKMAERGLASPDRADALVMTFYGCCSRNLANIRVPSDVLKKREAPKGSLDDLISPIPLTKYGSSEYDGIVAERVKRVLSRMHR